MPKCKITYEYIQYDGTNHKEVELFIKQRECVGKFKMNCCVGSLRPSGIKNFKYRIYDPTLVKEDEVEWIDLFEGQYLIWNPKSKHMMHLNMSDFKNNYEEDNSDSLSEAEELLKKISEPPHTPNPWYPAVPPQWPSEPNPLHPPYEVWCNTNTKHTEIQ